MIATFAFIVDDVGVRVQIRSEVGAQFGWLDCLIVGQVSSAYTYAGLHTHVVLRDQKMKVCKARR